MIPIGDNNLGRTRTPYVNYILIVINIVVFIYYQQWGGNQAFTMSFATVPAEILSGRDVVYEGNIGVTPMPVYFTFFTSMFMHGSIGHIAGNMLYLWVFGDNLENVMGHRRYFFFYLLTGIIATLSHVLLSAFLNKDLYVPSLGASGAISGVLGGYLLLFPTNKVKLLVFLWVITVPAFLSLGLWIGWQLYLGWGSLSTTESAGVAYAAHIGGFFAGILLVKFFKDKKVVVATKRNY